MTIIYAILIFCFLIFVHELGHFIVAKSCGVKVNEFAIGMGPAIHKWEKGETTYTSAAFENTAFEVQTKTEEIAIDSNAHSWGEITYTWADDNSTVTATRVCNTDSSHVEIGRAHV